jgi:hypothetical protein
MFYLKQSASISLCRHHDLAKPSVSLCLAVCALPRFARICKCTVPSLWRFTISGSMYSLVIKGAECFRYIHGGARPAEANLSAMWCLSLSTRGPERLIPAKAASKERLPHGPPQALPVCRVGGNGALPDPERGQPPDSNTTSSFPYHPTGSKENRVYCESHLLALRV